MRMSNFALAFMGIIICFFVVLFINIDITTSMNTQNTEYANKLTSACYDAAQSMHTANIEKYGHVWDSKRDLNETLEVFYNSLSYSFNWDTLGKNNELALYTPVVVLVDMDGYYISHNIVFDNSGMVELDYNNIKNMNGLTGINTWTETIPGTDIMVRYYLNDIVEVTNSNFCYVYKGDRKDVYSKICEKYPDEPEVTELAYFNHDDIFNSRKNRLIVKEIENRCEYYINRHNIIGDKHYEIQYMYEIPEVKGEDWNRLLENPTVISFLQGYAAQSDTKLINLYSLAAGEIVINNHYFIDDTDTYHCIEAESGITSELVDEVTQYKSKGIIKETHTLYRKYLYNGHEINAVYYNQTECAKRGATPHKCVMEW